MKKCKWKIFNCKVIDKEDVVDWNDQEQVDQKIDEGFILVSKYRGRIK